MKIQATIVALTALASFGAFLETKFSESPVEPNKTIKPLTNMQNQTIQHCPIVGDGKTPVNSYGDIYDEEGVPILVHCRSCNIGAYTLHEDNKMSCSYCGKEQ